MGISSHIEKVYQRALALRQQANGSPMQPELLDTALQELYFVLEELQAADEEVQQQNQALIATHQTIEIERQRYLTLFELAPDGYLVTDRLGLIYHANRAAAMLCGMPQDYLAHKPLIVFIAEGDRPSFQARLANPGAAQDWEITLLRRDQTTVTVAISVAVLQNSQGEDHTLLWLVRDITPRKQMEQQLQAAHDRLEQQVATRTAALTAANAQLQQTLGDYHQAEAQIYQSQRLESLGTLASGLAHDLNNALTPVITAADMLLQPAQALAAPACDLARLIKASGQRSIDLIQQLLLFAQGTHAQRLPLWLRQPLLEVVALLRPTLPSTIDLVLQLPPDWPYRVLANPTQLQQIFLNLCLNARDAMPQGGTLTLAVADHWIDPAATPAYGGVQPGHYGVITVADTGIGMAPSLVERIFDPFFTTKPHGQGTGLGLSTVFSLVKHHNGFLQVESQVGLGTEFRVYLPILDSLTSTPNTLTSTPNTLPPNRLANCNNGANCPPDALKTPYDTDQS